MAFELQGITKFFEDDGRRHEVLAPVNITIRSGEFLCLMGPSGCGKSTLLRIMAGLTPPSSGRLTDRPERVGFVFQNFGLMPWLTAEENIAFGLKMQGASRAKIHSVVTQKLHQLGLSGLGQRHPKELSGGQKQRVGIARALAVGPEVLMLDEPFSALDAFTADELRADLLKIWQETGQTIIMVTHLPSEAAELADRIMVFSARPGRIISQIDNRLPRPRNQRTKDFFALTDRLESLIQPG